LDKKNFGGFMPRERGGKPPKREDPFRKILWGGREKTPLF